MGEDEEIRETGYPANWVDFATAAAAFVHGVAQSAAAATGIVYTTLLSHANHLAERHRVEREMVRDIERLTGDE